MTVTENKQGTSMNEDHGFVYDCHYHCYWSHYSQQHNYNDHYHHHQHCCHHHHQIFKQ